MTDSIKRFTEIQRQVLEVMRHMFTTGIGSLVVMQDQGEKLLRMLAEKGTESGQARLKIAEEWVANLRKAQADFQRAVEDSLKRAEECLERTEWE